MTMPCNSKLQYCTVLYCTVLYSDHTNVVQQHLDTYLKSLPLLRSAMVWCGPSGGLEGGARGNRAFPPGHVVTTVLERGKGLGGRRQSILVVAVACR